MIDIRYEPHPQLDGWRTWAADDEAAFHNLIGEVAVRPEGGGRATVRWVPGRRLANPNGNIHGAAILAFADVAMFAGARACGVAEAATSVTVECSCQFLGSARLGEPLEASVELLRETRRLVFMRLTLGQGGAAVAAISGIIRKIAA